MLENRLVNTSLSTCEIHLRSVLLIEVHKNESRPQTIGYYRVFNVNTSDALNYFRTKLLIYLVLI